MRNRVSSFRHTIFLVSSASQQDVIMDMSRGTISSFVSSPFTLTVILSRFKWKSLRFGLTLTRCGKHIQWILTTRSEQTDQILSLAKRQRGRIRSDLKAKSDLHAVWTKAFCWRELRGFESRLTSPAEVIHSGHVSPWWRKPNDAGQLSTEETLSLFVRVLQIKLGSELDFTLVPETKQDSWIPTVDRKLSERASPLHWQGSNEAVPLHAAHLTFITHFTTWLWLVRKEREWISWLPLHAED